MKKLIFILTLWIELAFGSRIVLFPIPMKSHIMSINCLAKQLKENGHEVYTVIPDILVDSFKSTQIAGLEVLEYHVSSDGYLNPNYQSRRIVEHLFSGGNFDFLLFWETVRESCTGMLNDEVFMKRVGDLNFDLAVVDVFPILPCSFMVPHIFKVPYISLLDWYIPNIPGSAVLPSFFVGGYPPPISGHLSFIDRLVATIQNIIVKLQIVEILSQLPFSPIGVQNTSLIEDFQKKGLVSSHITRWFDFMDDSLFYIFYGEGIVTNFPKPLYPNMIIVDEFTPEEAKPLPQDLEALVESAEHGLIVVSFGTFVRHLPVTTLTLLLNAFGRRKELFIMSFKTDSKTNLVVPDNVKLLPWIPQRDLLGHNKTKLFITHAGSKGVHEAVFHGVPLLCAPIMGDQYTIAFNIVEKGYGLKFDISNFSEEEIVDEMEQILNETSFKQRVVKMGQIMRHKPMNSRQTAAFWIEHVIKFGGEHLKPTSINLYWWQYFCIDTIAVIALAIVVFVYVFVTMLKFCFNAVKAMLSVKQKVKKN